MLRNRKESVNHSLADPGVPMNRSLFLVPAECHNELVFPVCQIVYQSYLCQSAIVLLQL